MSAALEKWESDLAAAQKYWDTERTPQAYEGYVMWCSGYLCSPELKETNKHWFCSDKKTREIALNSLAMFSFVTPENNDDPAFQAYHRYLTAFTSLVSSCQACARGYQQAREELVLRLFADGPFDKMQVVGFVKELNHKDRTRLMEQITTNMNSLPVLTEILWSVTCIKASGFVSKYLIEPGLLTGDSALIKHVGACPGIISLAFNHNYKVRQVVMKQIIDHVPEYGAAWNHSPEMFKHLFMHGLKSYSKARVHADFAWFTAAQLIHTLGEQGMLEICFSELAQSQLGLPRFGAHFLLMNLLDLSIRKDLKPNAEEVQRAVDYVCTPHANELLVLGSVDTGASQAAQMSESYKKLNARTTIDWIKRYAKLKGKDSAGVARSLTWMLQLPQSTYNSVDSYAYAVQIALKIISSNLEPQLFQLLDDHSDRICGSIDRCAPEYIWILWQHQVSHPSPFLSIWAKIIHSPALSLHAAQPSHRGYIAGLLQGSRDIPILFKQAPANHAPPKPTQAETIVKELLETLTDNVEANSLLPLLKDPQVLFSVLFTTMSGNRGLSLAGEEFTKTATVSESLEHAILELVMQRADVVLDVLDTLLLEANKNIGRWFSVLSGLLRLSSEALEQIYAPQSGIDTTNTKLLHKLREMWPASWAIVRSVLSNIRPWAREYGNSQAKPIISKILEFSQRLLSKFRLLEADLASGMTDSSVKTGEHWGTLLAQPVMDCVPAMADLLQLSMPEMLAVAHEIIVDMLGLMRSFEVPVPSDLFTLFKHLGNHTRNSKLSEDQLRELLAATGLLTDEQVTEVMNTPRELPEGLTSKASNSVRTPTHSAQYGQQRAISEFFQRGSGPQPIPPRKVVNNQVVPTAPMQSSNMAMLRNQLGARSQMPQPQKRQPLTIHPERPPGFNQRKPLQQDESDESDEEAGGALSILNAKRREDAAAKLRQAYNNKPRAELMTHAPAEQQRLARAEKERESRRMKARLSVEPTELHRAVLQWDYFASSPPFRAETSVPDVFTSVEQYEKVMSPLLLLEAWEQIQNAKDDPDSKNVKPFAITVGKRVKVDGFTDAYVSVAKSQFADAGIGEGDLILLGQGESQGETGTSHEPQPITQNMPHCFARLREGTVRHTGSKQNQFVDLQIRVNDVTGFFSKLRLGAIVSAQVTGNMRTVEREYCALKALPYYDLAESIIKARPQIFKASPEQVIRVQQAMGLNKSQAEAVSGATAHDGFSLIQGPPGTGKTKTILGIVGSYFTNNEIVAQAQGSSIAMDKKILICAPSNAAVDEIVLRLKGGVTDASGKHFELNVLRLGRLEAMSEQVRDVSLEEKVSRVMSKTAEPVDDQLRRDHTALTQERDGLRKKLANTEENLSENDVLKLRNKLTDINRAIREKNYALDTQRDRLDQSRKQRDLKFRQEQNDILAKAQVVCTTLSASAHPLLASLEVKFPTVIIDEAAQSIELSALIPMRYGCTQCIMVGDPNQLPPTVISRAASKLKYEQSLFVRMFNQHHSIPGMVSMLDTQFRMHPEISRFPSKEFYNNRLKDGDGLEVQRRRPWHTKYPALGPYTFFEVKGRHERSNGRSLKNTAEAKAALALVRLLRREFPEVGSIGVISPYREQVRLLRQMFVQSFGPEITAHVDFNSIDGFQGQEKDVIVMSCVRATSKQTDSVGFLGDVRRMNVAVTRARSSLWILGSSDSLVGNEVWRALIEDATARDCFCKAEGNDFMSAVMRFGKMAKTMTSGQLSSSIGESQVESHSSATVMPMEPDATGLATGEPDLSIKKRKAPGDGIEDLVRPAEDGNVSGTKRILTSPEVDLQDDQNTNKKFQPWHTSRFQGLRSYTDDRRNGNTALTGTAWSNELLRTETDRQQRQQQQQQQQQNQNQNQAGSGNAVSGTANNMPANTGSRRDHRSKAPASVFIQPRRPGARRGRT